MKEDMKELKAKIEIEVAKHNKEKAHGKYRVFQYQKGFRIFRKGFATLEEASQEIDVAESLSMLAYRKTKLTIEDENEVELYSNTK